MSRGISGGKQMIKFANTSDRDRIWSFYQYKMMAGIVNKVYLLDICIATCEQSFCYSLFACKGKFKYVLTKK